MKFRDYLAIALLIVVAIVGRTMTGHDGGNGDAPRRPDPRQFEPSLQKPPPSGSQFDPGKPLPGETAFDPRVVVEIEKKQGTSIGTAFSIDRSGVWITAHHVTSDCDLLGLQKSDGRLLRVRGLSERPDADISILRTQGGTPQMNVIQPRLRIGDDGYSFGFPQGSPGDVHGKVIGRGRMLTRGRYRKEEPVVAWTQIRRVPDIGPDLSGISGGPWVDAAGDVIGVHVAGSPRRGRSYSTAPRTLLAAIQQSGVRAGNDPRSRPPKDSLTPRQFARYGNFLRQELTVAKVVCLVGDKWRRLARQPS
ncbi:MAG: S1 family peptidase [Alphaproteobacteria bacterium]